MNALETADAGIFKKNCWRKSAGEAATVEGMNR